MVKFSYIGTRRAARFAAPVVTGLITILALLAARIALPDPFMRAQAFAFDTLQRARPWDKSASQVRIVDIDEESLARYGQWPWPRNLVARLITRLQNVGAAAIALDAVFAEPDRASPSRLAALLKQYGSDSASRAVPDYDEELAAAIARGRVVTGFGLLPAANHRPLQVKAVFATIGGDPAATIAAFHGVVSNLQTLQDKAAGQGNFSIAAGRDEVIRRLPMISAFDGRIVPSLAAEALRVAQGEDTMRIRAERSSGADSALTGYTLRIGAFDIPLTTDGALWIHHGPGDAARAIPAWRLLDETAAGDEKGFENAIVLVGTSALGLADLRPTPINPFEPGVNIHARAIEQAINGNYLIRPIWAAGAEVTAGCAAAILLMMFILLRRLRTAAAAMLGFLGVALAIAWSGFGSGYLFDPTFTALIAGAAYMTTSIAWYFVAERDAGRLRSAFAQYLSPLLVEQLAADPDQLRLGGELREMTFLFTDLEGFTTFAEAASPPVLVRVINDYLDGLCQIAMEHGGTIDKIVGDAVHVMFNAPVLQPDHAVRGVQCALAMDEFARDYAERLKSEGMSFGATRIGVNTGEAVVGNFGGARRFDYTAHGDAINTAARLEAANKSFGSRICVARATAERVPEVTFRPIGTLMLKGKECGVEALEPLAFGAPGLAWAAIYSDVFARLSAGEEAATVDLLSLHSRFPEDPILAFHARRLRAGERSTRMAA